MIQWFTDLDEFIRVGLSVWITQGVAGFNIISDPINSKATHSIAASAASFSTALVGQREVIPV